MSDVMLLGVLRMPMPDNPDPLTLAQFVARARQAADRIEAAEQDTAALDWIERQHLQELGMGLVIDAPGDGRHYVCGDSGKTHYGETLREALGNALRCEDGREGLGVW